MEVKTTQGGFIIVGQTIQTLSAIVKRIPQGTNLNLVILMWTMISGGLLESRGAIFPALKARGFSKEAIRRVWNSLRYGKWSMFRLLRAWHDHVETEDNWQAVDREGYSIHVADMSHFHRPTLKNWLSKGFHHLAGKAVPSHSVGILAKVGHIGNQRLAIIQRLETSKEKDDGEQAVKQSLLSRLAKQEGTKKLTVFDAGFRLLDIQTAGVKQYVVRLAKNATARRNYLPKYAGRGTPPKWGAKVYPLARKHKDTTKAASIADETATFTIDKRTIQVDIWHHLVRPDLKPHKDNPCFSIMVFHDPAYTQPLVLAVSIKLQPETVFRCYRDRWTVEQIPLATKQMIGVHRLFVFQFDSCMRLIQLALLAGNVLSYLAASMDPIPSGFWDCHPKKRLGAYAEPWLSRIFLKTFVIFRNLRKKIRLQTILRRALRLIAGETLLNRPILPDLVFSFSAYPSSTSRPLAC